MRGHGGGESQPRAENGRVVREGRGGTSCREAEGGSTGTRCHGRQMRRGRGHGVRVSSCRHEPARRGRARTRICPEPASSEVAPKRAKRPGSGTLPPPLLTPASCRSTPKSRPAQPPVTIMGTIRPRGIGEPAVSTMSPAHAAMAMARQRGEKTDGRPRRNTALTPTSPPASSSVPSSLYSPAPHLSGHGVRREARREAPRKAHRVARRGEARHCEARRGTEPSAIGPPEPHP